MTNNNPETDAQPDPAGMSPLQKDARMFIIGMACGILIMIFMEHRKPAPVTITDSTGDTWTKDSTPNGWTNRAGLTLDLK